VSGIRIDLSDFNAKAITDEIEAQLRAECLAVTTAIFVDLTAPPPLGTPVDTGVARNGWQLDLSDPLAPEVYNSVPYIGALNNGHSKQSPIGFVDTIVDKHAPPK
jgi:hypothetical protein